MIELTKQEEDIIIQLRAEKAQQAKTKALALRRIQAAANFMEWILETQNGLSYSTFCDDFGYEPVEGEDRPVTYDIVVGIIRLVHKI